MSDNTPDKNSADQDKGPRFYTSQEEQEAVRLQEALKRSGEEKFYFLMRLMKLQQTLSKGTIEHTNG